MLRIQELDLAEALRVLPKLNELLRQLSPESLPVTPEQLKRIFQGGHTVVLGAYDCDKLRGTATLVVAPILNKTLSFLESVVVDQTSRGEGIGHRLVTHALRIAQERGAISCALTSRTSRREAHRLYLSLGFKMRETNVFRYTF